MTNAPTFNIEDYALGESPIDLEGLSRRAASRAQGAPLYHYNAQEIRQGVHFWELTVFDSRGGGNKQVGDFDRDFDRFSQSTIDTRFQRTGVLPPLLTEQTSPDPAGTQTGIHFDHFLGSTVIATGATDDVCLFKETSATDPTLVAITGANAGRPGASFTFAKRAIINNTEVLILGRVGDEPFAMTALDGTLYGTTAHATFNPTWGVIPTFLGHNLFYSGSGIYSLSEATNWDTAPTQAPGTVMKAGGFALGLLLLGGGLGQARAYWAEPEVATTSGILAFGSEKPFRIVSTNLEGTDKVPFQFTPDLSRLFWAVPIANGFAASDKERIVWKDGANTIDQEIFVDQPADSDKEYRASAPWVIGETLKVRVERRKTTNGTGDTQWSIWETQINSLEWHQVSAWKTNSGTGSFGVMPSGSLPWSQETHYIHHQTDGSWWRQEWTPPNVNTFTKRKTTGAANSTGSEFEASGTWTAPAWELPGLQGKTKVWAGFVTLGDIEAGGTGAYIEVGMNGVTQKINANTSLPRIPEINPFVEPIMFDKFQPVVSAYRQTSGTDPTRYTPNIFPLYFYGFAFDDVEAMKGKLKRVRLGRRPQ